MFRRLILPLALRNLRSDWFGTLCAVIGVALGTATVDVVLILDLNTRAHEAGSWSTDPDLPVPTGPSRAELIPLARGSTTPSSADFSAEVQSGPVNAEDSKEETHEDYQVMRSAIRLGSLSAFLVGALIVFFTFRVVIAQRRREIALLRSLGATKVQVAAIFLTEATLIGAVGAILGFIGAPIVSVIAAKAGITTTGRARLYWLFFPFKLMALVAVVGMATAILGVIRPLQDILRLDVASALQPRALGAQTVKNLANRGYEALVLPFMVLLYLLVRPFFRELLPSLAFFVLEAGLVCLAFTALLVLVPRVIGVVAAALATVAPIGPRADRLLILRRIQRSGHEISWSVSGVMMVFALLLALHILTYALKEEVARWARPTIEQNAYMLSYRLGSTIPDEMLRLAPDDVIKVRYSARTPAPNSVVAVDTKHYRAFAEATDPGEAALARKLGPQTAILSSFMARRLRLQPGDDLRIRVGDDSVDFRIVGISDLGYTPVLDTYRTAKTFVLISADDFSLIAPIATKPLGGAYAFKRLGARLEDPSSYWHELFDEKLVGEIVFEVGSDFMSYRVGETDDDFIIFDLILFLTAVLAAVGIANNLVLAAHVRRREIALYRVLGMTAGQVRRLFLIEGLFIGAVGGVMAALLGAPLGYLSIGALRVISTFDVGYAMPWLYPLYTVLGAIVIALIAAIYPALRAAGQSSNESLKYE